MTEEESELLEETEEQGDSESEEQEDFEEDKNLEELTETTMQNADNFSVFIPSKREFAAPVLPSDTPAEDVNLEEVAGNIPASRETTTVTPGDSDTGGNVYSERAIPEYTAREGAGRVYERQEERAEEIRFEPRGLIADAARIAHPIVNPFVDRGRRRVDGYPEEDLDDFAREQKKYEERTEEEQTLPFRRIRRKTKIF